MFQNKSQTKTMNPKKRVFNLLLPYLFFRLCTSIDTIGRTQSIKDGDILVSTGETFALGFFSPENSNRRYVGIWYNKISEKTIVWVANRDSPINGTSGVLSLNRDGNLVIYDNTRNSTVWQTYVSAVSFSARLLDSGNLVLFQGDSGSNGVVWQSFDHPTNTMLPNMKLGLDRRTGLERFLTTWKSRDDPGTGEYSYRIEPNELPQIVLFKGSTRVWRIPAWLESQSRAKQEVTLTIILNGTYVNNRDEVSTFYTLINPSNVSILFLDELGSLKIVTWVGKWVEFYSIPEDRCDYYSRCGVYGYCDSNNGRKFDCTCLPGYKPRFTDELYTRDASGGCIRMREALSMCGNGEGFVKVPNARIPDTFKARVWMNRSVDECKEECVRNCSCLAYTSDAERGTRANCITWYETLMDVRRIPKWEGGVDLYVRVDAVELAQHMESRRLNGKMVAVVVTSAVLTSVLTITLGFWSVMKKRRRGLGIKDSEEENVELPIFDMITIAGATNNFSEKNKIGEGGFGSVYKGHLSTGDDIAVKRLSTDSKQGLKEFKNEVILIAKLQHRNLVSLLGCCIRGEERMLVYEYMPNGSLDSFIFEAEITRSKLLTWSRRLDIIVGIARGVLYLHQDSRLRVIHRDLKASNVLLDSEMNPKISDFGLARAFGGDQSSAKTKRVVGTYGYMAPEYAIDGLISTKSDIFSFGVIVLEIMSGKRNRKFHHADHDLNLLGHAWKLWIDGKASGLIDPLMEGSFSMSKVLRCIQIGLLCVQKFHEDRPTMSSVVSMLVSDTVVLSQPKQPGFYIERSSKEMHECSPAQSSPSINEVTMSHIEAR